MDLGKILGRFWEAQIIDFRNFFDIFSMQNLECNLGRQKIKKNCQQEAPTHSGRPTGLAPKATGKGREGVNPSPEIGDWSYVCSCLHALRPEASADLKNEF